MPTVPLVASPIPGLSIVESSPNSLSSSVFDGSIDHVWISFPEPPHHNQTTSNSTKRARTDSASSGPQVPVRNKPLAYTRFDWNFLSTLSPTVLGWFCVINRIKKPIKKIVARREKRRDAVLAYFLIEMAPLSTLPQSKLYYLFAEKTKFYLSHPICQLVGEIRRNFNRNNPIDSNLHPKLMPDLEILKQGIRESCRRWAQNYKLQTPGNILLSRPHSPGLSSTTASPSNNLATMSANDQNLIAYGRHSSAMTNRLQNVFGYESTTENTSGK